MIEIFSIDYKDRFNAVSSQNLRGCPGSFVHAIIKFYAHWELINVDVQVDGHQLILTSGGSWIDAGFQPGDDIKAYGPDGLSTTQIVSLDDKFLLTNYSGGFGESGKFSVYGTSSMKGFRFSYGLVENNKQDSFFSRLDSKTTHEFVFQHGAALTDGVPYSMDNANGKLFWLSGPASERELIVTKFSTSSGIGYGKDTYYQIDHIFYIPPFVYGWLDTGLKLNKDLADWYADKKSPRYCWKIEAATDNQNFRFSTDNSNIKDYELKGSVPWFGFQSNGLRTKFSIKSITYNEDVSGDVVTGLLSNAVTRVTIKINAASPSAFTNDAGQRVETFFYEKVKPEIYTDPSQDMWTNFNTSYGAKSIGGSAINYNHISDYTITYISATELNVTFKYHGNGSLNPYAIWIETQSGALNDLKATDKTALLADENILQSFFNMEGVVDAQTRHIEHPFNTFDDGTTDLKAWIEDGIISITQSKVLKQNNSGQLTALKKVNIQIVAQGPDDNFFELEATDIAIGQDTVRDFKLPVGDIRLRVAVIENTSVETAEAKYYTIYCGYKIRFEDWLNQNNTDVIFIGNDNKKWDNYSDKLGFDLKFYVNHIIEVSIAGIIAGTDIVRLVSNLFALTYDEYKDCPVVCVIQTIDEGLHLELGDSESHFFSNSGTTRIKATFTGPGLDCYVYENTEFWGWLHLYGYKEGTISTLREISTLRNTEPDSPWLGLAVGPGNKALLTKGATLDDGVTIEALLPLASINPNGSYSIAARLGKTIPKQPEGCNCPAGSTYNPITSQCDSETESFPCSCTCDTGYTYNNVTHRCEMIGGVAESPHNGDEWAFGRYGGITFKVKDSNGRPTAVLTRRLLTLEGCAISCDNTGNLIVYSDGVKVYNFNNALVNTGEDLKGGPSATSSVLILKKPGSTTLFYIFTCGSNTGGTPTNQFIGKVSVYNTALNSGNGGFDSINQPLDAGDYDNPIGDTSGLKYEERIAAFSKGGTTWVLYKQYWPNGSPNLGDFYVYPLTSAGIGTRVVSPGSLASFSHQGYIKICAVEFAPNIHLMVELAFNTIYLYDFNALTGVISNKRVIDTDFSSGPNQLGYYGCEFSASGQYLYVSMVHVLFNISDVPLLRFDITSGDASTIEASKTVVALINCFIIGALQRGPDKAIYFPVNYSNNSSFPGTPALSSIDNPDSDTSTITLDCVPLGGNVAKLGLPTFDTATFLTSTSVPCKGVCSIPDFDLTSNCPSISIIMSATKGRTWIVTDNKGTTPITISSNDTFEFGNYGVETVEITLTDNVRPECSVTRPVTMSCAAPPSSNLIFGIINSKA